MSTSGASGVGGGMYQRSLSVPVMKGGTGAAQTVMRGVPTGPGAIPATQIQQGRKVFFTFLFIAGTFLFSGLIFL